MNNPPVYRKPKRESNFLMWFLILLLIGGIAGGGYYAYQIQEADKAAKILRQKEAEEKQRLEKLEQEKKEQERKMAEEARLKSEEEARLKKEQEEARRKAEELAKQEEERKRQLEEEARKKKEAEQRLKEEEERLRREREQDELDKNKPEPDKGDVSKPSDNKLPDLKPYTPESKDSIPMDKDVVIGTWSWEQAEKYDLEDFPTANQKWSDRQKAVKLADTYKKWLSQDVRRIKASPSAKDFPGVPEDGAELVERTVIIDTSISGWHSTGLYAPPGAEISFSFTGGSFKNAVSVRIGCHTDSLIHDKVTSWSRLPVLGVNVPVTTSRVSLAEPSGGLVYVCVNTATKQARALKVKISGATPAPLYIMGETTPEQWVKQLETTKAPWGEIRTPRLIYTMSIAQLKQCEKIKEVAEVLQKGMALQDWIAGWDDYPARIKSPMRFVVDRQISIGYGHSGYPAMGYMEWADSLVSGSILTEGDWGLWHELGHNHQGNPFSMEGQTEVSVNIFTMLCQHMAVGMEPHAIRGLSPMLATSQVHDYLSDNNMAYNSAPNEVQLFLWGELMYHFGPEIFREVQKQYNKKPYKNDKMSDTDKWNWVMREFGKILKKDLSLYFETWKLPIDNSTKTQLKRFPQWKPGKTYPSPSYLSEDT